MCARLAVIEDNGARGRAGESDRGRLPYIEDRLLELGVDVSHDDVTGDDGSAYLWLSAAPGDRRLLHHRFGHVERTEQRGGLPEQLEPRQRDQARRVEDEALGDLIFSATSMSRSSSADGSRKTGIPAAPRCSMKSWSGTPASLAARPRERTSAA